MGIKGIRWNIVFRMQKVWVRFIELWGGRPHAFAPDLKAGEIEEVKRLVDKYEIPVLGYTPEHNAYPYNFMIGSELQRRDAVEYLKICLDVAKELGLIT